MPYGIIHLEMNIKWQPLIGMKQAVKVNGCFFPQHFSNDLLLCPTEIRNSGLELMDDEKNDRIKMFG